MLERWVMGVVVSFLLRQLEKLSETTDWADLKKELEAKVREFVPGTWFDDEAVSLVNMVLDQAKAVLANGSGIKVVLDLAAAKKWNEAALALKSLLLDSWIPTGYKKGPNGLVAQTKEAAESIEGRAYEALKGAA